jgi:hypothetical protein
MILTVSGFSQAYVKPYERDFLNILNTLGTFVLITTQVLSILYFYAQESERPFMDTATLEVLVTLTLFIANALSVVSFAATIAALNLDLVGRWRAKWWTKLRVVTDEAAVADALAQRAEQCRWRHPVRNVAVERGPTKTTTQVDRVGDVAMWAWVDAKGDVLMSQASPTLLVELDEGEELEPGDHFCFVRPKTGAVSDVAVEYAGVGNCCTDRARVARGGEGAPLDTARAVAALRRSAPRETLNPVAGLAIGTEGASVAASVTTTSRSTAIGEVQRFIGGVRLKVDVARAQRATKARRDGGEEAGIAMRHRAAEL